MDALIVCRGLSRRYASVSSQKPVAALDAVDLEIARGEWVSIMGPSGCGKSTLLHILGCLDRPSQGSYCLDGKEVSGFSEKELTLVRRRKIGFVFQAFYLLPRLSVLHNVELPLVYQGVPRTLSRRRAADLLRQVGLEDRMEHRPTQLSGGERQRAAIARALANDPDILLADEPTGNLDSKTGQEIFSLLEELHRMGKTLLVVTHDSDIACRAERIITLKDGKIVSQGPPGTPEAQA